MRLTKKADHEVFAVTIKDIKKHLEKQKKPETDP